MSPINSSFSIYSRIDQAPLRMTPVPKLPVSVIERIADLAYGPTDAISRISLKAISKDFRDLDITLTRKRQWEALRTTPVFGIVDIPSEMRHIERTYVQNPLHSINRYTEYFRRLTRVFCLLGASVKWGEPLKTSPADYTALQNSLENVQLERCWPAMRFAICFELGCSAIFYKVPHDYADAESIRSFLGKEGIKRVILSIGCLNLTDRNLVSLPKEITLFSSLRDLDLSCNQFVYLPTYSFVKRQRDPVRPYVYNEVPAFPHLRHLYIGSYNRFSVSPFREVRAVPSLNMFPRLTHLSFNIKALSSLTSIERLGPGLRTSTERLKICLRGSKIYEYMMDEQYCGNQHDEIEYGTIFHFRRNRPISPLGKLYHTMLYTDATMMQLQEIVSSLPAYDRDLLYYCIWKYSLPRVETQPVAWGRNHCFADEHLLRKCIGLSIQEKFRQIQRSSQDKLTQVYQNLWDQHRSLRGRPFEERWAIDNRFNNYAVLADAMSTISPARIENISFDLGRFTDVKSTISPGKIENIAFPNI